MKFSRVEESVEVLWFERNFVVRRSYVFCFRVRKSVFFVIGDGGFFLSLVIYE